MWAVKCIYKFVFFYVMLPPEKSWKINVLFKEP